MLADEIESILKQHFPEGIVQVSDPMQDQTHLEAIVVDSSFSGKSLVAQHRMVMSVLKKHFDSVLHALALKTYTPEKWGGDS